MELSLAAAFSPGGLVGHAAYIVLTLSMLMRNMFWLRILVILSAILAVTYYGVFLKDPVGVFWEGVLIVVNIVQVWLIWLGNRRARFSDEERHLVQARLSALDARDARRLLNLGHWVEGAVGTVLTQQDEQVRHLVYLYSGTVRIEADGRDVGLCGPGNFVGEMSLVGDTPASASAVVAEPARYWMIETAVIRALRNSAPELAGALDTGIAHDLKLKLVHSNRRAGTV